MRHYTRALYNLVLLHSFFSLDLESSVKVDRVTEQRIDNVGVAINVLVSHKSEDTHLGRSAVIEFDGTEAHLLILRRAPQEANRHHGTTKVSGEGARLLLPEDKLHKTTKGKDLKQTSSGDLRKTGQSSLDGSEGMASCVNVTRKAVASFRGEESSVSTSRNTLDNADWSKTYQR